MCLDRIFIKCPWDECGPSRSLLHPWQKFELTVHKSWINKRNRSFSKDICNL